jgi:hypothetical protein
LPFVILFVFLQHSLSRMHQLALQQAKQGAAKEGTGTAAIR